MGGFGSPESRSLRTQVFFAMGFACLYALALTLFGLPFPKGIWAGVVFGMEIFVAARLMTNVFRYFQPKSTLSLVPIVLVVLLAFLVASAFRLLYEAVPTGYKPLLYLPNYGIHVLFLFFILWVQFYEWWFLKNESRSLADTKRLLMLQEDLKNAEIKNIQQNFQPHFLFNSLNSINALTVSAPEEAQKMVVKLSDFLRHSILDNQYLFVTLKAELDQVKRYLAIEEIRFANRLSFDLKHDEQNDAILVPAMILQPLIENAIKHGLYGQLGRVEISMHTSIQNSYLTIELNNPIDENHVVSAGTGYGLSGIRKKLYLLYAENNLLTTNSKQTTFQTLLKIPIQYESATN